MKSNKHSRIHKINHGRNKQQNAGNKLHAENKFLRAQIAELKRQYIELEEQAIHDPLTGLYNRWRVESILTLGNVQTEGNKPVSVIMLDMDNLKTINDVFGHATGDMALQILGKTLKQMTRPEDVVCRYGGDEFIVFLHNVDCETAYKRAEEWRRAMEENPLLHQGEQIRATITVGIATYTKQSETLAKAIETADEALYWAKSMGRNCVATADNINQTLYFFPRDLLANKGFVNAESGFCN